MALRAAIPNCNEIEPELGCGTPTKGSESGYFAYIIATRRITSGGLSK